MSTCPAIDCATVTDSDKFMCRRHWFQVPPATRNTIWTEYRAGRAMGLAYCEAAITAIKGVAAREGKTVRGDERGIRLYTRVIKRASDPTPR